MLVVNKILRVWVK